jgi:K+-transporting ATPase ATPase A chain
LQAQLPLNPAGLPNPSPHLAFNTAASFTTNTDWQSYGGETTLSYLSQMLGPTVQNFLSAAVGIVIVLVLVRGFARRTTDNLGNFWVDVTRCILWILLPMSILLAIVLMSQGVIQNFSAYKEVTTLEGVKQVLAMGPVASQVAIKQLGTNGGGFFNANSAVPFENPTPLAAYFEMVAVLAIPAGLTYTFGKMIGDTRQGWVLFAVMTTLVVIGTFIVFAAEQHGNPILTQLGVDQAHHTGLTASSGGNMEGKEVRSGIADSAIWITAITGSSNGSVNSMVDSFMPLGGMVAMFNIHMGEIFGGVGTGVYGMVVFALVAVFVGALMIGRTPEYLGKKIGAFEVKMAVVYFLISSAAILLLTAVGTTTHLGKAGPLNAGPHGFSEILYAFTSGGGNNGSAFAGLTANAPFYDTAMGIEFLICRYIPIVAILAIAGVLARKQHVVTSAGTLPTHTPLFTGLLTAVVFIIGGLTFFPALALGPIVEHFLVNAGQLF